MTLKQKRIAIVNDLTGFGRCSLAAQIPVISAMKIQACPLPTAILSVHTGFKNYFMDDYTKNIPDYVKSWRLNNLEFDGAATGFLGSAEQINLVADFIKDFPENVFIDPVMGDHGKIYASYTGEMCLKMRELLKYADLLTPNLTEACELSGIAYPKDGIISDSDLAVMAANLAAKTRGSRVVITGVTPDFDDGTHIINFIYDRGKTEIVSSEKLSDDRSGTGDVFFAVVAAGIIGDGGRKESGGFCRQMYALCRKIEFAEKLRLAL